MQLENFLDTIISLLNDQTVQLILLLVVIVVIIGLAARRRGGTKQPPVVKTMTKMLSDIERGREFELAGVPTRQSTISSLFEEKMSSMGMKPSTESGYIPVSYTPLSRFLAERGVSDDIISAILAGLKEEDSEEEVREIIEAAATTAAIDLTPQEIEKAQQLGVEEWARVKRAGD
jgi:hypothetical protein